MSTTGAILLAGGRASRVGGAVKPLFEVGGRTLLDRAVAAVRGCAPVTVVADPVPGIARVAWAREEPPFSGPAAAVIAALASWERDPEWTLLLACDLPGAESAVVRLRDVLGSGAAGADGVCLSDESGRQQWLAGLYRTTALRRGAESLPDRGRDASLRALLAEAAIAVVPAPSVETADVDTWEDLAAARARYAGPQEETMNQNALPPEALDDWAAALRERFGLGPDDLPVGLILDLARDVANGVARPAAPFSAFVAGLVAGRAGGSPEDVRAAVTAVTDLAAGWQRD